MKLHRQNLTKPQEKELQGSSVENESRKLFYLEAMEKVHWYMYSNYFNSSQACFQQKLFK